MTTTNPAAPTTPEALHVRITEYLMRGGLFNPEQANHEAVRDLLIDCQRALAAPPEEPAIPWPKVVRYAGGEDTSRVWLDMGDGVEVEFVRQESGGSGSERVVPPEIAKIARNLHTQDNRITYNPLFAVQQKRRIYGLDVGYCDNAEWILDGETWTPEDGEEPPADARKVGYIDIWEFVTGGFTEQGCKDYIAANGHNLREPRIYAYGSYRNAEFIALRKWLMSLESAASLVRATPKAEAVATLHDDGCFTAQVLAEQAQPDMRHPKIQALIGSKARREIELRIAEDLLDDPAHEISGTDGDYWLPLHDKIVALQQQAQPAHADGRASDLAAELRECREALKFAESKLTNMQPHIEQACYPGRAKFIDNYVDPVIDRIRAVRAKGGAA